MRGNDMNKEKKFVIPEAEVIILQSADILANDNSQYLNGGVDYDEELP